MIEQKKYSIKPGLIGCFMSVLLIVSFFLPRIWKNDPTVESFNTILIVITMCLAVHLIRITSLLFYEHVWNNIGFTVLWLIPVTNLIIAGCQFVWEDIPFMQGSLFTAFLIIFSLPAFCCYYFTVIWLFCIRDRILTVSTTILDAVGLIYILIRFADRVILPVIENTGTQIVSFIHTMVSFSPMFSLIVYLLSFVNFIICAKLFNSVQKNST